MRAARRWPLEAEKLFCKKSRKRNCPLEDVSIPANGVTDPGCRHQTRVRLDQSSLCRNFGDPFTRRFCFLRNRNFGLGKLIAKTHAKLGCLSGPLSVLQHRWNFYKILLTCEQVVSETKNSLLKNEFQSCCLTKTVLQMCDPTSLLKLFKWVILSAVRNIWNHHYMLLMDHHPFWLMQK